MARQRTVEKKFFLEGKGLQTGRKVKAFFYPGKEREGIIFVRKDLNGKSPICLLAMPELGGDGRRTTIGKMPDNYVETVEHLLAALWAAEIDNIKIELDSSEPPALDGSALGFLEAFKKTGIKEQNAERKAIEIKRPLWVEDREAFLGIFPGGVFKISYILESRIPGAEKQFFSKVLDPEVFREEIAPARTIWMVPPGPGLLEEKAEAARKAGYGRGADSKNTLVIGEEGPINANPELPDEAVRHKVLDLIGDLYLLGRPLRARVIAVRASHKLNLELVKKIREEYVCR